MGSRLIQTRVLYWSKIKFWAQVEVYGADQVGSFLGKGAANDHSLVSLNIWECRVKIFAIILGQLSEKWQAFVRKEDF